MKKEIITQEERINARTQEIRAQRQRRARRNQKIAIAVSSVCAVALLAGIGAFSISMMNRNSNSATKQAAPAKLAAVTQTIQKPQELQNAQKTQNTQPTQNAQKIQNTQPAQNVQKIQNTQPTQNTQNTQNVQKIQNTQPTQNTQNTQNKQGAEEYNYVQPYKPESNKAVNNNANTTETKPAETKPAETKTESNNTQNTGATGFHHSGAVSNGKGTPLHFYAQGQTTVGYNWKYEGGEYLVDVGCDYNFSTHTYDFSLIGLRPGSSTITVYHYTDDNTKVPTVINFTVDENLNVTYR